MRKNSKISALYDLNLLLVGRMKRYSWFYGIIIGIASFVILIYSGVPLVTNIVEFIDVYEVQVFNNFIVYSLIMVDVLFICLRFSSETLVEPTHLVTFPVSIPQKILLNLSILIFDYRAIPYVTLGGVYFFEQLIRYHVVEAFMALLLILFLYINSTVWMYLVFFSSGSIMGKYRSQAIVLVTFLTIFNSAAIMYRQGLLMTLVPLTSYAGNGIFLLSHGELLQALLFLLLLAIDAILGFGVLVLTYQKR